MLAPSVGISQFRFDSPRLRSLVSRGGVYMGTWTLREVVDERQTRDGQVCVALDGNGEDHLFGKLAASGDRKEQQGSARYSPSRGPASPTGESTTGLPPETIAIIVDRVSRASHDCAAAVVAWWCVGVVSFVNLVSPSCVSWDMSRKQVNRDLPPPRFGEP